GRTRVEITGRSTCRTGPLARPRLYGQARKPVLRNGEGHQRHGRRLEGTMQRSQRTIARAVETSGIGFLTGADVRISFGPAPADHGITFLRTDCANAVPIPALVEFTVPRQRRTAIEFGGIAVEMIEHVMAALAGLRIDNCLVSLNAPEPPGCDGSSLQFAERL